MVPIPADILEDERAAVQNAQLPFRSGGAISFFTGVAKKT
jgi:hypothetical protein